MLVVVNLSSWAYSCCALRDLATHVAVNFERKNQTIKKTHGCATLHCSLT